MPFPKHVPPLCDPRCRRGCIKNRDLAAYDALSADRLKLGRFHPWISQSYAEGAGPSYFTRKCYPTSTSSMNSDTRCSLNYVAHDSKLVGLTQNARDMVKGVL